METLPAVAGPPQNAAEATRRRRPREGGGEGPHVRESWMQRVLDSSDYALQVTDHVCRGSSRAALSDPENTAMRVRFLEEVDALERKMPSTTG